jgi:hypothetical protein
VYYYLFWVYYFDKISVCSSSYIQLLIQLLPWCTPTFLELCLPSASSHGLRFNCCSNVAFEKQTLSFKFPLPQKKYSGLRSGEREGQEIDRMWNSSSHNEYLGHKRDTFETNMRYTFTTTGRIGPFLGEWASKDAKMFILTQPYLIVCMWQLENSWENFYKIWHWRVSLKFVNTFQF